MIEQTEAISTERALKLALEALEIERNVPRLGPVPTKTSKAITALREALANEAKEQPAPATELREQEPVAWVYSEGLEALKNGKPWTAYGTKQEANNIALYLHPTPECEPYAWVTFTPYGDEDDVWYENPEGQLLEGWTYKPLYDTAPPRREWVGLTDEEVLQIRENLQAMEGISLLDSLTKAIEAKLKEKNA